MTNRLRTELEEAEQQSADKELIVEEIPVKEIPDNYVMLFLKRVFNADQATKILPFILFIVGLGMLYIANRHLAEKNIRDIDKISRQVKELSYDYKSTKAELAFKSTLTEVAKRADTLGIKESAQPPAKFTVEDVKDEH